MKLPAILLLSACALLKAHELGTSRVSVAFQPTGAWQLEVVTDATALAEKLASVTGRELSAGLSAASLQAFLIESDAEFRKRVKVRFDGSDVSPAIAFSVAPPIDRLSVPAATIHLTGQIPNGTHQFTWSYGWTFASYAFTVETAAPPVTQWLDGAQTSQPVSLSASPGARPGTLTTVARYFKFGFTHIMPNGLDHILFVLGIYLLSRRARDVLWQVSAFTLAHSLTLGLSVYGVIAVSSRIVEPVIALSIAYVAIENIVVSELKAWRVALVFAFGLLHGLGFAGALRDLTLPRSEFLTALVTFNAGVEAGQLSVIALAFVLVGWQCSHQLWYRKRIVVPASAMIAGVAVYWTVERVMS